jgi:hypothetical protein
VCILFADAFQRLLTAHRKPGFCVVCLPAIGAFQRHSTQHLLHYGPPFGFHFCFRSVPSSLVQRTGCSACGLGYPHQVWWDPPMYIARAWPRWASPVCQRTSACRPPGLSPRFLPTAGLYKAVSAKKSGSPTGSQPMSFVYSPFGIAPPRGGGARSCIAPCSLGRSSLCLFHFSNI